MPDSIDHYVQLLLEIVAAAPIVRSSNVVLDKRTLRSGLLRGDLYFLDGSSLHQRFPGSPRAQHRNQTPNSELQTRHSKLRIRNSKLETHNGSHVPIPRSTARW